MFLSLQGIVSTLKMVKKDDFWGTLFGLFLGAVGLLVVTEALKHNVIRQKKSVKCRVKRLTSAVTFLFTLIIMFHSHCLALALAYFTPV
jgi:uncharacterized membrane protein HdeD (DUF308 family)